MAADADPRHAPEVDALIASYDEPAAGVARALRPLILHADDRIREGVKWKSPSYHAGEHFATLNVRPGRSPILVLHRGAKVRPALPGRLPIPDPASLLDWRTNDRANVVLRDAADVETQREFLRVVVSAWIAHL